MTANEIQLVFVVAFLAYCVGSILGLRIGSWWSQ